LDTPLGGVLKKMAGVWNPWPVGQNWIGLQKGPDFK